MQLGDIPTCHVVETNLTLEERYYMQQSSLTECTRLRQQTAKGPHDCDNMILLTEYKVHRHWWQTCPPFCPGRPGKPELPLSAGWPGRPGTPSRPRLPFGPPGPGLPDPGRPREPFRPATPGRPTSQRASDYARPITAHIAIYSCSLISNFSWDHSKSSLVFQTRT